MPALNRGFATLTAQSRSHVGKRLTLSDIDLYQEVMLVSQRSRPHVTYIAGMLLVAIASAPACQGKEQKERPKTKVENRDSVIADVARAFAATTDFAKQTSDGYKRIFSLDVQDWVMHGDTPFVYRGQLADVMKDSTGYLALFEPSIWSLTNPDIFLQVSLTEAEAKRLQSDRGREILDDFIVIAIPRAIYRRGIGVDASSVAEEEGTSIEFDPTVASFVMIRGTMVHARKLPL